MMKYLPKLNQLLAFQAVIQHGSIRAAARALEQTQPALTRTIKELEHIMGAPLLVRGSFGVTLTDAGRAFASRSSFILEEIQRAAEEISLIQQSSQGSIAFGISPILAISILPQVIGEFSQKQPQTKVTIEDAQLPVHLPRLRDGKLDFVIGVQSDDVSLSEFIVEPLFAASYGIIARKNHPYAQCTSFNELADAKWWLTDANIGFFKQLEEQIPYFQQHKLKVAVRSDSLVCGLPLLTHSDYLGILSVIRVELSEYKDLLCILPIKEKLPQANFVLIYPRKMPLTQTAQKMIGIIRWHCKQYNWQPTLYSVKPKTKNLIQRSCCIRINSHFC